MALGDDFTSALDASNNTLTQTPGLAVDAATSGDPAQAGLLLSHTAQVQAAADAANNDQQKNSGGGLFHHLLHGLGEVPGVSQVGHAVATAGSWLAKPLQSVQTDYRYLHEVYARQGIGAGFLATLGVAAGGTAGFIAGGGFAGAALGADAAIEAERRLAGFGVGVGSNPKGDVAAASDPNAKISFGRDLSNALGQLPGLHALTNTDKGWGKVVSGLGDASFDIGTDPLLKGGAIYRDLKYGTDVAAAKWAPVRDWLGANTGLRATSPEAVDTLRDSPFWGKGYRRVLGELSGMSEGDIVARYPELRGLVADRQVGPAIIGSRTVKGLASASTEDEVHQVFAMASSNAEFAQRMYNGTLPSRNLMRYTMGKTAERLRMLDPDGVLADQRGLFVPSKVGSDKGDWRAPAIVSAPAKALSGDLAGAKQDVAGAVSRKIRTFSGFLPTAIDKDTMDMSRSVFDPMDPEALLGVYRATKYSMGETRAREFVDQFSQAQTIGQKKLLWNEGMLEMLKAAGLPNDPELLRQVSGFVRATGTHVGSSQYGWGKDTGGDVSKVGLSGGTIDDMALWSDQRGKFAFPDFSKVKSATRQLHGLMANGYDNLDDLASEYTKKIFKPFALVNTGFGLRVATSELIPALLRYGPMNEITGKINVSAAKVNYKLDTDRYTPQADSLMSRAQVARANGANESAARYEQQAHAIYEKAAERVEHYHVLKAASTLLGGASKFLGSPDADRDLAYRMVMRGDGQFLKGFTDTSHGTTSLYYPDAPDQRAGVQIDIGKQWLRHRNVLVPSGDYQMFSHDSPDFTSRWHLELQKRSQNLQSQNIAGDLLNAYARGGKSVTKTVTEKAPEGAPAWSGGPALYHGTAKRFEGDALAPSGTRDSGPNNLFGYGFYTTDDQKIAGQYMKKGAKGAQPQLADAKMRYSVKWNGSGTPNLIDLDQPVQDDIKTWAQHLIDPDQPGYVDGAEDDANTIERLLAERASSAKVIAAVRGYLDYAGITQTHAQEIFADLADTLQTRGFDGLKHVGGEYASKSGVQHNVHIFFDNSKLSVTPNADVTKTVTEVHPTVTPDEAFDHARNLEAQRIRSDPAYRYDSQVVGRHDEQGPELVAANRVDALRGLTEGRDDTIHTDLLRKVAAGEKPTLADVEAIDPASRPAGTIGEIYAPPLGHTGRIENVVSMGYRKLVDPVINGLSREPTYFNAVKREWENMAWLRQNGLSDDDALRIAQYRGAHAMLPQIHNTELRTQFHALSSNYMPFFFAQQQALQRATILVAQNPQAIRGLQLAQHGLNDPGFVQNDGSGNRYLMLPMLGELGKGFQNGAAALGLPIEAGLPISMSGSMESLKTVLPEMQLPGVAPMVSIPMNAFSSLSDQVHAPWAGSFDALTKQVLGDRGYGAGFFDSIMPNQFIRNTIMAASPDEQSRSFSNAVASAIASAYYHGDAPAANASPSEKQAFMDRIKNNARSLFLMKALVGLVSPLSPQVGQEDPGFRDEFYALVKKQGYSTAIDTFLREHGSKSISYTVAHTAPTITGSSLPYTQKAMDWINAHQDLISSPLATGAAFLVPQDPSGGDAQKLSNEYLKMNLRERRTPTEFLNAMYVAAGNSAITADKTRYDAALKAAQGDTATTQALRQAWSDHLASMQAWNPVWYDNWASPVRSDQAVSAYEQLQVLFASGRAPAGPQTSAVATLMDAYQAYVNEMAGLATQRTAFANDGRQSLKDKWSSFLDDQMNRNPQLAPVIRAVFTKLPDTPAAASRLDTGTQALQSGQVSPLDLSGATG